MDTKVKQVSSLGEKVVTTVVTSLAASITAAKNSAMSLLEFCKAAKKAGFPNIPSEADVVLVADKLSAQLGWAGTPREKVSKSEVRSLLRQHALLPEAITAVQAATGSCGYHDAIKTARLIKEHGNVGDAVIAMTTKKEAAKTDPAVRVVSALKALYASTRDSKKTPRRVEELKLILNFAIEMGWDIGQGGK